MHRGLARLAADLWDLGLENAPSSATLLGDHRFDHLIEDLSEGHEAAVRGELVGFLDRAQAIDPGELSRAERVTRSMIITHCHRAIDRIDSEIVEMHCDQLVSLHAVLMRTAAEWAFPAPDHAEALLQRLHAIPAALDQAMWRFRAAVRKGRPPARITVLRSLSMLDGYLASPLDGDMFVNVQGPAGWEGENDWRDRLQRTVREVVRPSFQRYRDGFEAELITVARPDDRSGLCWVENGDEIYATAVAEHTTVDLDPQDIHETGRQEIDVTLADQYAQIGQRAFGTHEVPAVLARLQNDPALRYSSADEILGMAQQILDRAKAAVGEWFGVLPRADCVIASVPDFIAKDVPAAYYLQPAPDGSRPGTYYVNLDTPTERPKFQAEAVTFHEAVPGHHLQLAIAGEREDIPPFQRHMGPTAYAEGWGLYAERLAAEMGLYSNDLQMLGMLSTDSWRAGRLVVDTGIHAKGWSRRQAADYLATHAAVSPQEAAVEIDRYIGWPGQALAYKTGQREILRLRDKAREALGAAFDIRGFHDTVLTSGPVTMPVLETLVDEWVADHA